MRVRPLVCPVLMTCSEQMRTPIKNLYGMRTALRWARQIASALAALHQEQPPYTNGDVKADNVFLTDGVLDDAVAKLGDLKPHRYGVVAWVGGKGKHS